MIKTNLSIRACCKDCYKFTPDMTHYHSSGSCEYHVIDISCKCADNCEKLKKTVENSVTIDFKDNHELIRILSK